MSEESTTPDLLERMRLSFEARNRGDFDEYMSFFAPDAILETRVGERLVGAAVIRDFLEEFDGSVEDFRIELLEAVDLGGDVLFSVARQGGRPGDSAFDLHERLASVCVVADGLIARITNYTDIDEARAVAERLAESRG
jgi:ketosteroid isomerase-like protein